MRSFGADIEELRWNGARLRNRTVAYRFGAGLATMAQVPWTPSSAGGTPSVDPHHHASRSAGELNPLSPGRQPGRDTSRVAEHSPPRRDSNTGRTDRSGPLASSQTRRLGDVRVLRPSETRSQRAGFTCSLTSRSETRESNPPLRAPNARAAPCSSSRIGRTKGPAVPRRSGVNRTRLAAHRASDNQPHSSLCQF